MRLDVYGLLDSSRKQRKLPVQVSKFLKECSGLSMKCGIISHNLSKFMLYDTLMKLKPTLNRDGADNTYRISGKPR